MHAPNWLMILFGGIDAITVLTYIAAYCYCLVKDREALRTETYSIRKLAIERGLMGDSLSGIFSATSNEQMKAIGDSSKTKQVEGEQ